MTDRTIIIIIEKYNRGEVSLSLLELINRPTVEYRIILVILIYKNISGVFYIL